MGVIGGFSVIEIKQLIDENISNYKKTSMFIGFPSCTFKCERECDRRGMCQNAALATSPTIQIDTERVVRRYVDNPLSNAIVIGGLEPFDSFAQLFHLVDMFRCRTMDDIVIYTGYYCSEIEAQVTRLAQFPNIIIKFGRYIPGQKPHLDPVLGVELASDNQYAEVIS